MRLLGYNEFIFENYNTGKYNNLQVINCGGSWGHMSHPYDDLTLSFSQIKDIIDNALQGHLNKEVETTEKLDGQALAISWKDGKLIASRNKGDRKNGGASALDVQGIKDKFSGRGKLSDSFSFAVEDLEKAISNIPDKEKDLIFKNGYAFMHLEIINPDSANVINYDSPYLIFHSTITYDENGNPISSNKDSAIKLQKLIKNVNSELQKHYSIRPPAIINIPKVIDFEKNQDKFLNQVKKIQQKWNLKDTNTIGDYIRSEWFQYLSLAAKQHYVTEILDDNILDKLINRFAFYDNSYTVQNMKKDFDKVPKFLEWLLGFSKKKFKELNKEFLKPFEELFLSLGVEVLKNASGFLAANPDKVVQDIKSEIDIIQKKIEKSNNFELLQKLQYQLKRLQSIGGFDAIVPSEGIVFQYNGKTYKLTGAFAPVNNLLGTLKYSSPI